MDDCSFRPKIIEYRYCSTPTKETPVKERANSALKKRERFFLVESTPDRCQYLYDLSKKPQKHEETTTKDEKEVPIYSFTPNIKRSSVKDNPLDVSKATVDKEIQRMRKANKERKRTESITTKPDIDPGMRFNLINDKFKGDFQQFENNRLKNMRNCYSMKKLLNNVHKTNAVPVNNDKNIKKMYKTPSKDFKKYINVGVEEPKQYYHYKAPKPIPEKPKENISEKTIYVNINMETGQKQIVINEGDNITKAINEFVMKNGT